MDQEKIGRFMKACRKQKNLTQEQLAEQLGVSYKTISKWENGRSLPNPSLYQPLCQILEINLIELFEGERIDKEDTVEKADQVIHGLVADNHKKNLYHSLLLILSWFFMVIGSVILFIPSLTQLHMTSSVLWICLGLFFLFSGMSMKLVVWGKSHQKRIKNEGMGFGSALTLILITLKLTNHITWSWVCVLAPIWIPILIFIIFIGVFVLVEKIRKRKKEA